MNSENGGKDLKNDPGIFTAYTGTDACFEMPESVTEIGEAAFANNRTLKHIDLGNVKKIGAYAFQDCTNLESVIMPNTVEIGKGAFEFCRSLSSVSFGEITVLGDSAFAFCGMLDIPEIPRSLINIGTAALSHTALKTVDLHWLEEIPPYLLSCCTSLEYADISGAGAIQKEAFSGCRALTYVRFGAVREIGEKAFRKCDALELAELPETLVYIGDDAFSKVRPGTVVPKGIRHIGTNCFGPVDTRKSIRIYRTSLYDFRNYFLDERAMLDEDDEHFYLWESSIDVTVLDENSSEPVGFLPLFSDLYIPMRKALIDAFRPDNTFDYQMLDTVFPTEMRWNQKGSDRLAVRRLMFPYELGEAARAQYEAHLRKHAKSIAVRAIQERDLDILTYLCDRDMIGRDIINELIDCSISLAAADCTAILLGRQAKLDWHGSALPDEL